MHFPRRDARGEGRSVGELPATCCQQDRAVDQTCGAINAAAPAIGIADDVMSIGIGVARCARAKLA